MTQEDKNNEKNTEDKNDSQTTKDESGQGWGKKIKSGGKWFLKGEARRGVRRVIRKGIRSIFK